MSDIKERLIEYLSIKGISKSEFGRQIGVSSAYITSMRKSIQPDKLDKIASAYPDLNITWLLTGEGEMISHDAPIQQVIGEKNMAVQGNGNQVNASDAIDKILSSLREQQDITRAAQEQLTKSQEQLSKAQEQMDRLITLLENK